MSVQPNPPDGPQPTASTPEPVLKAAAIWGTLSTFIVSAVGVLVAVNVFSAEQAELAYSSVAYVTTNLVPAGSAVVGLVGLVSGLVSPFVTAIVARRKVTPVAPAPVPQVRESHGGRIVP